MYDYATITLKKKNMIFMYFDFVHVMNTIFVGNLQRLIRGRVRLSIGPSVLCTPAVVQQILNKRVQYVLNTFA